MKHRRIKQCLAVAGMLSIPLHAADPTALRKALGPSVYSLLPDAEKVSLLVYADENGTETIIAKEVKKNVLPFGPFCFSNDGREVVYVTSDLLDNSAKRVGEFLLAVTVSAAVAVAAPSVTNASTVPGPPTGANRIPVSPVSYRETQDGRKLESISRWNREGGKSEVLWSREEIVKATGAKGNALDLNVPRHLFPMKDGSYLFIIGAHVLRLNPSDRSILKVHEVQWVGDSPDDYPEAFSDIAPADLGSTRSDRSHGFCSAWQDPDGSVWIQESGEVVHVQASGSKDVLLLPEGPRWLVTETGERIVSDSKGLLLAGQGRKFDPLAKMLVLEKGGPASASMDGKGSFQWVSRNTPKVEDALVRTGADGGTQWEYAFKEKLRWMHVAEFEDLVVMNAMTTGGDSKCTHLNAKAGGVKFEHKTPGKECDYLMAARDLIHSRTPRIPIQNDWMRMAPDRKSLYVYRSSKGILARVGLDGMVQWRKKIGSYLFLQALEEDGNALTLLAGDGPTSDRIRRILVDPGNGNVKEDKKIEQKDEAGPRYLSTRLLRAGTPIPSSEGFLFWIPASQTYLNSRSGSKLLEGTKAAAWKDGPEDEAMLATGAWYRMGSDLVLHRIRGRLFADKIATMAGGKSTPIPSWDNDGVQTSLWGTDYPLTVPLSLMEYHWTPPVHLSDWAAQVVKASR